MKGISTIPDKIGPLSTQTTTVKTSETDSDIFKKTLETALTETKQNAQPPTTPSVTGLGEIQAVGYRITDDKGASVEQGTDKLLSLLNQYTNELSDPGKTLKDIEPLMTEIKAGADSLAEAVKTGSASDAMKNLAEKSSLLANVEYIKFMRGDYV